MINLKKDFAQILVPELSMHPILDTMINIRLIINSWLFFLINLLRALVNCCHDFLSHWILC